MNFIVAISTYQEDKNIYELLSKIPKFQIITSFIDLLLMKFKDLSINQKFHEINKTLKFDFRCKKCKQNYLTTFKKKFICLVCNIT